MEREARNSNNDDNVRVLPSSHVWPEGMVWLSKTKRRLRLLAFSREGGSPTNRPMTLADQGGGGGAHLAGELHKGYTPDMVCLVFLL